MRRGVGITNMIVTPSRRYIVSNLTAKPKLTSEKRRRETNTSVIEEEKQSTTVDLDCTKIPSHVEASLIIFNPCTEQLNAVGYDAERKLDAHCLKFRPFLWKPKAPPTTIHLKTIRQYKCYRLAVFQIHHYSDSMHY